MVLQKNLKLSVLIFTLSYFVYSFSVGEATLGNWTIINNLNVARATNVAVIAKDTIVYTFGGFAYTTIPYPVEKSTFRPDGTLSNWVIDSSPMIKARHSSVGAYDNGYIYAISGAGILVAGDNTTAERAQVNSDGTLSSWTIISILPRQFYISTLIQTTAFIYIIGGYQGSPDIYRTTLNPDGTIGTWTLLSSHLLFGRDAHSTILINTTLYVVGGEGPSGFLTTNIEKAIVYPDGQLGAFTTISNTGAFHTGPGLVFDGSYLYVIEGYAGGSLSRRSEKALVNSDGNLGSWQSATAYNLHNAQASFGFLQTNTAAYSVGGSNGSDITTVEYAPILQTTDIRNDQWQLFE